MKHKWAIVVAIGLVMAVILTLAWKGRSRLAGESNTPAVPETTGSPAVDTSTVTPQSSRALVEPEGSYTKAAEAKKLLELYNHKPIEFFGLVLDQDNNPVSDVEVYGSIIYNTGATGGTAHQQSKTDNRGRFHIGNVMGRTLSIGLAKQGYKYGGDQPQFHYTDFVSEKERHLTYRFRGDSIFVASATPRFRHRNQRITPMKKYNVVILLVGALVTKWVLGADINVTATPVEQTSSNEHASPILKETKEVRISIRDFITKSSRSPNARKDRISDDQIKVLIRGLNDSSESVRGEALQGLSLVAAVNRSEGRARLQGIPDLAQFPTAGEALLKLADDSNPNIRASAMGIYALTFPLAPELEARWLVVIREDSSDERKEGILKALLAAPAPSTHVISFAVEQLKNPQLAYGTAVTLLARIKPPPAEALPLMVSAFSHSTDPGKRDLLARGIVHFGAEAKEFLPVLREMETKEKDATVKANLARAIAELQKR